MTEPQPDPDTPVPYWPVLYHRAPGWHLTGFAAAALDREAEQEAEAG